MSLLIVAAAVVLALAILIHLMFGTTWLLSAIIGLIVGLWWALATLATENR